MRNRWVFWATVTAALSLCAIPSAVLWDSFLEYYRFLTGYQPGVLKPTRSGRLPRHAEPGGEPAELAFVEFKLKAPKARRVLLMGDLNRWAEPGMVLHRQPDGVWEALIPLAPGRYGYRFEADGTEVLDPDAEAEERPGRGRVSIKTVR